MLGGKEYGSGSSRDWAAKGTLLLGVRAVLVESFERIHRSNLIGMGVLPLQYRPGESAASLGLTGHEVFEITGIEEMNSGTVPREVTVRADGTEFRAVVRIDTPGEAEYFRHGGIMQYVLRSLLSARIGPADRRQPASGERCAVAWREMPDPAAPPAPSPPRTRRYARNGVLLVAGVIAIAFNLRAAITSLPPLFPELSARPAPGARRGVRAGRAPGAGLRRVLRGGRPAEPPVRRGAGARRGRRPAGRRA